MAKTSRWAAKAFSTQLPANVGNGNHLHNQILLNLPSKECSLLFPKVEFMRLEARHVLHEPGEDLKFAYFCNSGLVSVLSVFPDGKSVDVGLIGKEGVIGLPLAAGFRSASTRAVGSD
jgi:CRP-like cAMP-binding protein